MTKDEFTREFADLLNVETARLTPETELAELEDWDSVAYLSAMVMIDERLGVQVRPELISSAKTFGAILDAVNGALAT
jgi:acyl carrier protein